MKYVVVMILYSNISIFIIFIISRYKYSNGEEVSESDDDKIKQALVLVDILKSGYIKALRENDASVEGRNTVTIEYTQTCVPTLPSDNENVNSHIANGQTNLTMYYPVMYRRKDGEKELRFNYDDAFGAHPNYTDRKTSEATTIKKGTPQANSIGTVTTITTTDITSKSTPLISTTSQVPQVSSIEDEYDTEETTKKTIKTLKHEVNTTNNPIMDQVAKEFINEMDETTKKVRDKSSSKRISASYRAMKKSAALKTRQTNVFLKTTLRIHMEGSTRYPIPLPENNAYCYINPKSALCRTFI